MKWNEFSVPVIEKNVVFHIGTLNQADRGHRFSESYEGHCLSVSDCPLAWRQIAKLGGNPLHEMTCSSAIFINVRAIKDELKEAIIQWGIKNGMVEHKELWQAWLYDDELESWRYLTLKSQDDALYELDCDDMDEAEGPNGGHAIVPVKTITGTMKLSNIVKQKDLSVTDSWDYLVIAWAEQNIEQTTGIWFDDELNSVRYKAPCGGIFPGKISQWQASEISWDEAPDDEADFRLS